MKWPHWRTGWSERHFGPWFIQYYFFSQWSQSRHALTLFALTVDPYWTKGTGEVGPSERLLMADVTIAGLCFHLCLCRLT